MGHTQLPLTQVSAAGHVWPHMPQLALSACGLTHAPGVPQSIGSAVGQVHTLLTQFWPVAQTVVQVPQWPGSLESVVQVPEQLVCPAAHPLAQALGAPVIAWQTGVPPLQLTVHEPQVEVVVKLVGHPAPVLAQSPKPETH